MPIFLSGVAVSENGRFLYESSQTKLFQIDLAAEDIANSRMLVGEYDGFFDGIDLFPTIFFLQQLAPDGRIIMNAGNTRYLHTIASPNKKGRDCNFLQHNINIPIWNVRTLPNFPYFGLGPWDGSPCDTLNINNPTPEAAFEYTVDSVGYSVDFFDGSHYAYEWEWDFGDGSSFSNEQYPLHTYTNPGAYEVCLTVSNVTGNDQYCEIIQLGPTATQAIFASGLDLEVYPNPFTTHFIVDLKRYNNQQIQLRVYNSNGYEVYSGNLPENGRLESKHWPSGLYFYELWEDSKRLLVGKLVKGE
ncbi:MAG: PKD domain-containing protein [Bacteroidota bacterium]